MELTAIFFQSNHDVYAVLAHCSAYRARCIAHFTGSVSGPELHLELVLLMAKQRSAQHNAVCRLPQKIEHTDQQREALAVQGSVKQVRRESERKNQRLCLIDY
ncbi:hypothetical protein XF_0876 [Xylella fastidiosa 9a5c]|uniref:Uncharacterized protein n=1 Tax=Xylella fastidiosa (strain 9a5c) TaxID=160492 RepID=Q9PF02_XYLFA|nr:hypothetical protein XF_0876 [Xylella fastidiosa 9a5c]